MQLTARTRRLALPALSALALFCAWSTVAQAYQPGKAKVAPQTRPAPPPRPAPVAKTGAGPRQNQEHLAGWMERHRSLSLPQQQTALQNEPGFRQYPPETQQRLLNRLAQLNKMPDEQRRRLLERNEAIEHLTPQQRGQVRNALAQLSGLPVDRRRLVARAFRDLREMPEPQRQAMLGSDRLRGEFSDNERSTLTSLLAVEPYIPVQTSNDGVDAGK